MKRFVLDFETITDPNDCRVWATGICSIDENYDFYYANNIDYFFDFCSKNIGSIFYVHNLKFDGEFIFYWLFNNGFKFVKNRKQLTTNTFTTLISDKGQFYSCEICFYAGADEKEIVTIYDSLKILPFSVETIAKTFGLKDEKLKIDYDEYRAPDHKLTNDEVAYIKNDVVIVAKALNVLFKQDLKKMTQGSNALYDFKKIITVKKFNRLFPTPTYDSDIRQAYKGAFVYCNPLFQNQDIASGIVLDINSLYPSTMYYEKMPYGEGKFFKGKYETDKMYDVYIQMFSCQFDLKEGFLPTLQLKNNLSFIPTEYVTSSNDEIITLCLSSVDIDLFFKHYNVYNVEYHSGWKFRSTNKIFREYIDKWIGVKIDSALCGNLGMYTLAKLMLNALYGKFATNPNVRSKYPYLNNDGIIKYTTGEKETRKPVYVPVGAFVTAYGRHKTITSAQKNIDRFIYADTDSLHLIGTELPDLDIDPVKLGYWKLESEFTRARFIRAKTYIEEINGKLEITCAGMPTKCYENVTWDNFVRGSSFEGKLRFTHVKGGIVLKDTPFTLKYN